jgi:hypothetical protein
MTAGDAMALVVGVALAFQFRVAGSFLFMGIPPWVMLVIVLCWMSWVATTAVSAVVACRLIRYRRGPRPAEWLAVLTTLFGILAMGPSLPVDRAINLLPSAYLASVASMAAWRWLAAGLSLGILAASLGLIRLGQAYLPPWLKAAGLAAVAFLALAGPIDVVRVHGPDLLAPSSGFGPGGASTLHWLTLQLIATIPMGLMFGVPAVAALIERFRRDRWRWDEWAGVILPLLVALPIASLYRGTLPALSAWGAAERALVGGWFVGVGMLSRRIVVKLGPAWSRWLGDQAEDEGSRSIDASPARTRPT